MAAMGNFPPRFGLRRMETDRLAIFHRKTESQSPIATSHDLNAIPSGPGIFLEVETPGDVVSLNGLHRQPAPVDIGDGFAGHHF